MKKFFSGILAAAILASLCVGCSDDSDSLEYEVVKSDESSSDSSENSSEESSDAKPGDWKALEVKINGELFVPKFDYSRLTEKDWSFDPAIYGLENYNVESGVYLSPDVFLDNPNYEGGIIAVGFTNTSSEAKTINEAQVYAIKVKVKDKVNRPDISVPGNIAFGATAEDIKAAFGEPSETSRNDEEAYNELTYRSENMEVVHYYVYDNGNMLGFLAEHF